MRININKTFCVFEKLEKRISMQTHFDNLLAIFLLAFFALEKKYHQTTGVSKIKLSNSIGLRCVAHLVNPIPFSIIGIFVKISLAHRCRRSSRFYLSLDVFSGVCSFLFFFLLCCALFFHLCCCSSSIILNYVKIQCANNLKVKNCKRNARVRMLLLLCYCCEFSFIIFYKILHWSLLFGVFVRPHTNFIPFH